MHDQDVKYFRKCRVDFKVWWQTGKFFRHRELIWCNAKIKINILRWIKASKLRKSCLRAHINNISAATSTNSFAYSLSLFLVNITMKHLWNWTCFAIHVQALIILYACTVHRYMDVVSVCLELSEMIWIEHRYTNCTMDPFRAATLYRAHNASARATVFGTWFFFKVVLPFVVLLRWFKVRSLSLRGRARLDKVNKTFLPFPSGQKL